MEQPEQTNTKAGFVALIGAPNAGKSTLLNSLVGSKVSIVSRKVQTTRALVRGIAIEGEAQLIFVDTPGIFKPKRRLDRAMSALSAGDHRYVASPRVDSYHSAWFELHEELILLAGRSRADEVAAGRA